jgi:hypothetical protein
MGCSEPGNLASMSLDTDTETIGATNRIFLDLPRNSWPLSDWIEDSILERRRRLREARDVYASSRTSSGRITLRRLISQVRKVVVASQSWFVVSIVGRSMTVGPAV